MNWQCVSWVIQLVLVWSLGCVSLLVTVLVNGNVIQAATTTQMIQVDLDPIVMPISDNITKFVNVTKLHSSPSSNRGAAYLVRTNYAWSVVLPTPVVSHNSTRRQNPGRQKYPLQTTLQQAQIHNCDIVATNGGPFDSDGWNTGPAVIKEHLARTTNSSILDTPFVGIGTTVDKHWVMGSYHQFRTSKMMHHKIVNFCTGFGWLVYNGRNVEKNTINPTGADRAPRTAIGLDQSSNILLLVVDGCEKW